MWSLFQLVTVCGAHICYSMIAIMSLPINDRDAADDEIECSFGSRLVLTPHEQVDVVIGSSGVSDSFIGFIYSLLATVLVDHPINNDGFINTFSTLWKGTKEVLIKKIMSNRLWVHFVSDQDKKHVLGMESWMYRPSLVLMANLPHDGNMHSMSLTHSSF